MRTGIEFSPDSCVLVRTRPRGDALELSAAQVIEQAEWPADDEAAAELLARIRRDKRLPRPARVVAWGLPDGAAPGNPATRAALRPLIAAGFRIDAVLSPAQALSILATTRPRAGAAAWVTINRHGTAIAIVRNGSLLFTRAFGWNWEGAAVGSQAKLLQRYSMVAHLGPEIRRGVEIVKARYGVAVDAVVTCGDLPDLRSLTMPLIDELDLEVETLDSTDGLVIPPGARGDRFPELSAVRLACAAAAGPPASRPYIDVASFARVAAFVAAAGGLGWAGYVWWTRPQPPALMRSAGAPPGRVARGGEPQTSQAPSQPGQIGSRGDSRPTPVAPSTGRAVPPPSSTNDRPEPSPARTPSRARATSAEGTEPEPAVGPSRVPQPRSTPNTDRSATGGSPGATATARGSVQPEPQVSAPLLGRREQTPMASAPADRSGVPRTARPAPLREPVPVIDTILVSSDRRLAVVDGAFVGIGDTVGSRTVVRIEVDAVYLREPSGLEIRVPIRMRRE